MIPYPTGLADKTDEEKREAFRQYHNEGTNNTFVLMTYQGAPTYKFTVEELVELEMKYGIQDYGKLMRNHPQNIIKWHSS